MAKKLFTVHVETTLVVAAGDAAEAEEIASGIADIEGATMSVHATSMSVMPSDWDGTCIPFGTDDDRTIAQWIEAGAAPELDVTTRGEEA